MPAIVFFFVFLLNCTSPLNNQLHKHTHPHTHVFCANEKKKKTISHDAQIIVHFQRKSVIAVRNRRVGIIPMRTRNACPSITRVVEEIKIISHLWNHARIIVPRKLVRPTIIKKKKNYSSIKSIIHSLKHSNIVSQCHSFIICNIKAVSVVDRCSSHNDGLLCCGTYSLSF